MLGGVRSHYSLDPDHPALERLSAALQELENAERRDLVTTVDLGTRRVGERQVPLQVILAKGNMNFVGLLAPGIPYRFLGLFTARRHLLGSPFSYVIVDATLTIPAYILGESALSLLGLGITEPQSSWGLMLSVARNHRVVADFPWILVPGVAIFVAIMAWNLFGDGIRDAVDPRSRL